MVSDARLLIFFSMFLCLFLMFSRVLRMARIFWFLQRGLSKKCQRGVLKNTMSLCNPFWHFFCKSVWRFTIFPKPLPESDSHMHHTHAPSENENFPSAKPPARTSFLSFFPSHFRSSFRHFCHVLCDFYFSFQVPKPPVFGGFQFTSRHPIADSFFSFFKTKKPHLRGIPWNKVSGGFMVFLISFFYLSFCLTYALFPYFPASPLPFGSRKSSKEIA